MRKAGVDLLLIQKIVGHVPKSTTEKVYTHIEVVSLSASAKRAYKHISPFAFAGDLLYIASKVSLKLFSCCLSIHIKSSFDFWGYIPL